MAQVLIPGAALEGAVRKSAHPGVYEILTSNGRSMMKGFIVGATIQGIMVPAAAEEQSKLFVPGSH
jgi:hypothetical protein